MSRLRRGLGYAVMVGLDRTVTYERLRRGLRAVLAGAAFYAVNCDPRLPVEDGCHHPRPMPAASQIFWARVRPMP